MCDTIYFEGGYIVGDSLVVVGLYAVDGVAGHAWVTAMFIFLVFVVFFYYFFKVSSGGGNWTKDQD